MKKTLTLTILFTLLSSLPALAQCETSNVTVLAGMQGVPGNTNGNGAAASFNRPDSVSVDRFGNVYVADTLNHLIRRISPSGDVSTLAGSGNAGAANGTGTAASFNFPASVAVDKNGVVYVADTSNQLIRKITL